MLPISLSKILQPELTDIDRLPPRASLNAYEDVNSARLGKESKWRECLDGKWAFKLVPKPDAAPKSWHKPSYKAKSWRDIQVPGVWTRQDTGDLPYYANWAMPFECVYPPDVPDENPTGLYRRDIEISAKWAKRRTILHIGGFESVALVWCNGEFIGMGKDSRLPSEFDLTESLHLGNNTLAIMVIRWSDGTWLEDQDHWNHAGIHRSVHIESRAQTHVQDINIDADFEARTGEGHVQCRLRVNGPSEGWTTRGWVEDERGKKCGDFPTVEVDQFNTGGHIEQIMSSHSFEGYGTHTELKLNKAAPWSAERPTRYRVITEFIKPNGDVSEVHAIWIGFKRVDVQNRRLIINGKPVILIGVNRHDHHHVNGKTLSLEDMRDELNAMKRANVNAIRTAHYPNDHRLLDIADELGFYVLDEANVESHARYKSVSNDIRFFKPIIERNLRMVARDRNHASIIGWSLGNESGHSPAHDAAAGMIRAMDSTRYIHYEGAVGERFHVEMLGGDTDRVLEAPSASERHTTDIVCPMYPSIEVITKWARWAEATERDDRPLIMCEYSHGMGNSNGSIADYVDAFFSEAALAGGFIWDWRDQGLTETDENGKFYWAYGGHYGEKIHDMNFNCNGIVGPDGTPRPALREYQWAARPMLSEKLTGRKVRVTNRRFFEDSSDLILVWSLQKEGVTVETGKMNIVIAPGKSRSISVPYKSSVTKSAEWHLSVRWEFKSKTAWAAKGYAVGWDQFALTEHQSVLIAAPLPAKKKTSLSSVKHGPTEIIFGPDNTIHCIKLKGQKLIHGDVSATIWRAATDNDGGKFGWRKDFPSKHADWIALGLNKLRLGDITLSHSEIGERVQIRIDRIWTGGNDYILKHRSVWTLSEDGAQIDELITIPKAWPDIPRVGVRFEVSKNLEHLSWHGLGPDESYSDRRKAQIIGRWTSTITEQFQDFVVPQEHGNHEGTRSFALKNRRGRGLSITLAEPLSFSARHDFDDDMYEGLTLADRVERDTIEVHIDAAMRGMGTGACGPDVLPDYTVGPGRYAFTWFLKATE